ncbi:uncharacterized protein LOC126381389 [Pectinophora gossypiella]|uniref:uncharacterized protein LOC126381389 n=1 Tax=Pectinophora gossypiella TaxID=13191 RepID=UPI00214F3CB7|nr:uncharacterized protein LOC126381389 [Pectinophora gossypiella]
MEDDVVLDFASTAAPEGDPDPMAPPEDLALNADQVTLPDLDPELLLALGESTDISPKYREKILDVLAQRWNPILKKGLPKESKEKLLKDYLVPENCTLLQAPKLNVEVAAAISETARGRDRRKESDQQQLGLGISIINKAMTLLLTSDNKVEAIKILSDGCRILTDLHYQETQSRITVVNYSLAKPFLNVVQDNERDETLYGVKLSEKIKASKLIEKQGLQIKKYIKPQKNTTSESTTTNARPQYQPGHSAANQGNWSAPSRFQPNRGGRRGQRRQPPTMGRRPQSQPATSAAGPARTRAPTRQ